jgi:hypothetical protein
LSVPKKIQERLKKHILFVLGRGEAVLSAARLSIAVIAKAQGEAIQAQGAIRVVSSFGFYDNRICVRRGDGGVCSLVLIQKNQKSKASRASHVKLNAPSAKIHVTRFAQTA